MSDGGATLPAEVKQPQNESAIARLLRSPFTVGLTLLGTIGAAFQVAGVTSMILASIILAAGVWIFITAEVCFSKWVKKAGLYVGSVVLLTSGLSGSLSLVLATTITELKRQQSEALSQNSKKADIAALLPKPTLAVPEPSTKSGRRPTEPLQNVSGESPERYQALSNVTDAVTIEVWFEILNRFTATINSENKALSDHVRTHGGLNTIDRLPPEWYAKMWKMTIGGSFACDAPLLLRSGMNIPISEHPGITMNLQNGILNGECVVGASLHPTAAELLENGNIDIIKHSYIFYFSPEQRRFGVRFTVSASELRLLSHGYWPPWRSFVIDKPKQLQMVVARRNDGITWQEFQGSQLRSFEQTLPTRIWINTMLVSGPKITREYKLVPGFDSKISSSGMAFIWKLTTYVESEGSTGEKLPPRMMK